MLTDRSHVNDQHWHELTVDSAISPDIAALNFASVKGGSCEDWERNGNEAIEVLLSHMMQGEESTPSGSLNDQVMENLLTLGCVSIDPSDRLQWGTLLPLLGKLPKNQKIKVRVSPFQSLEKSVGELFA